MTYQDIVDQAASKYQEMKKAEAAAQRDLKYNTCSYKSMSAILAAGLDRQPDTAGEQPRQMTLLQHDNIMVRKTCTHELGHQKAKSGYYRRD